MAKEALVWGRQALESLASAPPSPSPSSAGFGSPAPGVKSPPGGLGAPSSRPPPARTPSPRHTHAHSQSLGALGARDETGGGPRGSVGGPGLSPRVERCSALQAPVAAVARVGLTALGQGPGAGMGVRGGLAESLEAQVLAWGESLVRWLTEQFSALLGRAERCKTELLV
ncbi:unnamed protein product, partial [Discosporangium mesarthrocarpum]